MRELGNLQRACALRKRGKAVTARILRHSIKSAQKMHVDCQQESCPPIFFAYRLWAIRVERTCERILPVFRVLPRPASPAEIHLMARMRTAPSRCSMQLAMSGRDAGIQATVAVHGLAGK